MALNKKVLSVTIGAIIGRNIKKAREQKLMTQKGLADESGVSVHTISQIELGNVAIPEGDTIRKIAKALGVSTEELRDNEEEAPTSEADNDLARKYLQALEGKVLALKELIEKDKRIAQLELEIQKLKDEKDKKS